MVERVEINSSQETQGPTLEESAQALGILDENGQEVGESTEESVEAPERPEGVPEKFWDAESGEVNVEALLKSYTELEKGKSSEATEEETVSEETAEEVVSEAGLDFSSFQQEFSKNGELSEDSYKSLEEAGIPKELVDQYIEGQRAVGETITNSMYNEVGGKGAYEDMVSWAADTFSESEIDTFNAAVTSGNKNQMALAVKGLQARYQADADMEPENAITGDTSTSSGNTYGSTAQLLADMSDPKYHNDPAFRQKVEEKLARSNIM